MPNLESTTLIKTKISRPLVRSDIVPRQRLLERLDHGLECPLTLVCAGAGFGKTTLVSGWVGELVAREGSATAPLVAWLSLDKHDSDLSHFLHYFIAAVRTVVPMACAETLGLLEQRAEPRLTLLVPLLTNELLLLPRHIVIVLDDYHTVQGTAVHNLLNELLQHWPQPLHLILISRHTPPLPIARLRAREDAIEIRNHDLRFTLEEIAKYVHRMWPVPLSQPGLEMLEQKTEGWIAGLQLASLSLRATENVEAVLNSLSGTNIDIAEYLADEVLSRQPRAFQTFLLKTSILDRFSVSLCEAIGASEDPEWNVRTILDWLLHGNMFIIPLDNRHEWYRFHPLFRDMLQQRLLAKIGEDEMASLHHRVAHWFAQNDLLDAAIRHALEAKDLNLAADLMEKGLCVILNQEDRRSLERWRRLLPSEFINSRPGLLMIKAWSLHFAWQIEAVSKVIQKVEALLEERELATQSAGYEHDYHQALLGQIATLKSQEAFYNGQLALCITYGQEALALLPPSWTYTRGGSLLYLALSMQAEGEGAAVEELLLELYRPLRDKTDGYALRLLLALCFIDVQAGQLERAQQTAKLLLKQATQSKLSVLQGWAHFILGLVHYQWNHLDIAGQHFDEIIGIRYRIHSLTARHGMIGSVLVHLTAGRHAQAEQVAEKLSQFDMELNGRLDDATQSLCARVFLTIGNAEKAKRWTDGFTTPVALTLFVLLELPQLARAQLILARSCEADIPQVLQILEGLRNTAEQNHNIRRQIESLAASALALDIQGKASVARIALQQAVELACPGGFISVFVDLGPRIQELLSTLVVSTPYAEFVHRILMAFPHEQAAQDEVKRKNIKILSYPSVQPHPATPTLVEPLTRREVQVLTLLREPLSAKEIALKLNISHATVKRHSINLYGKLDVNSRWDAIARAEALGILSSH